MTEFIEIPPVDGEIHDLAAEYGKLSSSLAGLEALYDTVMCEGASYDIAVGVETLTESPISEDYPNAFFTKVPSNVGVDVAVEGIVEKVFSALAKIIEVALKAVLMLIKGIIGLIGKVTGMFSKGGNYDKFLTSCGDMSDDGITDGDNKIAVEEIDKDISDKEKGVTLKDLKKLVVDFGVNIDGFDWDLHKKEYMAGLEKVQGKYQTWKESITFLIARPDVDKYYDAIKQDIWKGFFDNIQTIQDITTGALESNFSKLETKKHSEIAKYLDDLKAKMDDEVVKLFNGALKDVNRTLKGKVTPITVDNPGQSLIDQTKSLFDEVITRKAVVASATLAAAIATDDKYVDERRARLEADRKDLEKNGIKEIEEFGKTVKVQLKEFESAFEGVEGGNAIVSSTRSYVNATLKHNEAFFRAAQSAKISEIKLLNQKVKGQKAAYDLLLEIKSLITKVSKMATVKEK